MASGSPFASIRSPFGRHPWQELEELWRALERACNLPGPLAGRDATLAAFIPEVDLYDAGSSIVIKMNLPGVPQDNLTISAEVETLTITGHRDPDCPADATCLSCERPVGRFARRIELPKNVDVYQVTATLRDGVLEITAPKSAKAAADKIDIKLGT